MNNKKFGYKIFLLDYSCSVYKTTESQYVIRAALHSLLRNILARGSTHSYQCGSKTGLCKFLNGCFKELRESIRHKLMLLHIAIVYLTARYSLNYGYRRNLTSPQFFNRITRDE